jgi:hypothetical protein
VEKARSTLMKKLQTVQVRLATAQGRLEKEKVESTSAKMNAGISILTGVLGALFCWNRRSIGIKSAITSVSGAFKQGKNVGIVEYKMALIQQEILTLQQQAEAEVVPITANFDPAAVKLQTLTLKPAKTDVKFTVFALLWLPFDERGNPAW